MPTTFEIFPAIGIARVGTSQNFFIGPEPDVPIDLRRRDAQGNLLRQAARFRIFECERDQDGKLLNADEITTADVTIQWSVRLVNRKAASVAFNGGQGNAGRRNNASGNDTLDRDLIIDSGLKQISNGNPPVLLDGGRFKGNPVPLGRLEMQPDGRLCVIGGKGTSRSPGGAPIIDFADNNDWHDDMGDGPVTARITRNGQSFDAKPAWVIVAPPDFAPEIPSIITMYDALFDLAVTREILLPPATIFYDQHILPILDKAMSMQWVNRQARLGYDDTLSGGHGPDGPGDFIPDLVTLGDPAKPNQPRQSIFRLLRDPMTGTVPAPNKRKHMPRLNDDNDSSQVLPLTLQQYRAFQLWSQGQFQSNDPAGAIPELLPDALTRVALQSCAGGAFFPGIEAGRIMREPARYMGGEAFRFSHAAVQPGDITSRNAVPWQADFHLCRWEGGVKNLAWWPAQRPDDVLKTAQDDPVPWARGLADTPESMVKHWHRLGFVKQDPANVGIFIEHDRDPTLLENGSV